MAATASTGRLPQRAPTPWINHALRLVCALYITTIVCAVVAYKTVFIEAVIADPYFGTYSVVVCVFILSRFFFSLFYHPAPEPQHPLEPTIAVVMPAFNEEDAVAASVRSLLAVDYPREKLEIAVVNDGSTDATQREIMSVARDNPRVRVIEFPENRGKRAAMAAGIRATRAAVVAFVDSDSSLERDALRKIVRGFADPRVGAIAGHAEVQNSRQSLITRMQAVRYFVAFRVCKAAESIFGAVTCCSGCFSAYRREAIAPILERWEHQRFLGRPATYGDDRSLTNFVLRHWKVQLRRAGALADDRSRALPPLPAPAAAVEALLDPRVADRRALHLAQEPARQPVGVPRDHPAAGRADRRGARGRYGSRSSAAPGRRSCT